jgi:glycyl-tRNA synthetase
MKKAELDTLADDIQRRLRDFNVSNTTDRSGVAIGRKYTRTDEIGVAFAITVDIDAVEGKGITVRERDSQEQIRVPIDEALTIVADLSVAYHLGTSARREGAHLDSR